MSSTGQSQAGALSTSALATAGGDRVTVLTGFESPGLYTHAIGHALTVRGSAGDNLALHRALADARKGELLIADVEDCLTVAHWGGLMGIAARHCGLAGVVLNGAIRDRQELADLRFPIFFRGSSPRPPTKQIRGDLRVPISIDGVEIEPGALVAADADGVVIVPADGSDLIASAKTLEVSEPQLVCRLENGERLIDLLGLTGMTA